MLRHTKRNRDWLRFLLHHSKRQVGDIEGEGAIKKGPARGQRKVALNNKVLFDGGVTKLGKAEEQG